MSHPGATAIESAQLGIVGEPRERDAKSTSLGGYTESNAYCALNDPQQRISLSEPTPQLDNGDNSTRPQGCREHSHRPSTNSLIDITMMTGAAIIWFTTPRGTRADKEEKT